MALVSEAGDWQKNPSSPKKKWANDLLVTSAATFFFPNETEAQSSRRAYQFLFNSEMFSPVWSTVHMYPVKMVTKNTSFLSKVKNFWKRRFLVYLWTDEDGGSLG